MKRICVLLNGPVKNDHRVIKMIRTLSKKVLVDLYYIHGSNDDISIFNENVKLFSFVYSTSFKRKLIQHSFFTYEFNFFIKEVQSKNIKYNYVLANDLPTLYPGWKIAEKFNAKLIYDSHEIYTEILNQFFPQNNNFVKKKIINLIISLMRWHGSKMEKTLFSSVDYFITVNDSLLNYFNMKYNIGKGISIMNLPYAKNNKGKTDYRKKYNWNDDDKIFLYQGVLNAGRGLDLIIETGKIIPEEFKIIILGDGPLKENLELKVSREHLKEKIKFIAKVDLEVYPDYTKGADFGINLLENINLSKKFASPNKLFEYIHCNIPIICSNTYENKKVLEKFNVGILVENNVNSIANGFVELINFEKNTASLLDNFEKAKTFYNWPSQESKLLSYLSL